MKNYGPEEKRTPAGSRRRSGRRWSRSRLLDAIDYVSLADAETLDELAEVTGRAMVSTAVRMGSLRLIDNVVIGAAGR